MNIVADLIARHGGMDGGADDMPGMNMTANSSASMGGMDHMSMGGNSCKSKSPPQVDTNTSLDDVELVHDRLVLFVQIMACNFQSPVWRKRNRRLLPLYGHRGRTSLGARVRSTPHARG